MGRERVDLRPAKFQELLDEKGYDLTFYHSMMCPCVSVTTGQPDPNCSNCDNGWLYYGERIGRGICTGISFDKQYADTGGFFLGSMQLTTHAGMELGFHDRVINKNSLINYSELVEKKAGLVDTLRYEPQNVFRLIDKAGTIYSSEGETPDFTISGRTITWADAEAMPEAGAYFSIAYQMHPVWLVLSYPHVMRDTSVKFRLAVETFYRLPIQVLAKLEWLCE